MLKHVLSIFLTMWFTLTLVSGLVVDDDLYGNAILTMRGRRLMECLEMEDGVVGRHVSQWHFPTSVVVRGVSYAVKGVDSNGKFSMSPETNRNEKTIYGRIHCMSDEYHARISAYGLWAMDNRSVHELATATRVKILDNGTNVWFISDFDYPANQELVLFKNVFLSYAGVSNKLDFAISLLNAGLPEVERLPPLQPQSNP